MPRPIRSNALAACPHAFARSGALARLALCVFLSVSLAFVPLGIEIQQANSENFLSLRVDAQRNEAQAFAPIAVGGAAAAAAALGITETELAFALAAVFAAGAGVYLYTQNPVDTNGSITGWPTDQAWPGFKPWDDLTPQEKQDWVGQDGTVDDYWQQQLDIYSMDYGLWEFDQNGNPTPTPEPEDPDDKEKWFTKQNVITALATGGSVALGTVASTLTNTAANSLGDLLFGKDDTNTMQPMNLQFSQSVSLNHGTIAFAYVDLPTTGLSNWVNARHYVSGSTNNYFYDLSDLTGIAQQFGVAQYKMDNATIYYNPNGYYYFNFSSSRQGCEAWYSYNSSWANTFESDRMKQCTTFPGETGNTYFLNAAWQGRFSFDGYSDMTLQNGVWNNPTGLNTNYGQMTQTPSELSNNLLNDANYQNQMNGIQNDAPSGEKKAVQVPVNMGNATSWTDWVTSTPESNIVTIPTDHLITPTPDPNPPLQPTDPEFSEDYGDKVLRLLSQPFDQLFPFCLIGDLRVFTEKVNTAFYDAGGTTKVDLPLDDFGIQGVDEIELEGKPLADLGHIVKPWINALLIVALLVGSFRFFLNRGGE